MKEFASLITDAFENGDKERIENIKNLTREDIEFYSNFFGNLLSSEKPTKNTQSPKLKGEPVNN